MDRASDRLGYDRTLMKRTERDLMNVGPDELVSMSTDSDLVPEGRWALAEKIRKNKTVGLNAVADALCRAAGMDRPDGMLVVTATTEDMFDDPDNDIKYVVKRWSIGNQQSASPSPATWTSSLTLRTSSTRSRRPS